MVTEGNMTRCNRCGRPATTDCGQLTFETRVVYACDACKESVLRSVNNHNKLRAQLVADGNAIERCIEIAEQEGFDDEAVVARKQLKKLRNQ